MFFNNRRLKLVVIRLSLRGPAFTVKVTVRRKQIIHRITVRMFRNANRQTSRQLSNLQKFGLRSFITNLRTNTQLERVRGRRLARLINNMFNSTSSNGVIQAVRPCIFIKMLGVLKGVRIRQLFNFVARARRPGL